MIVVDRKAVITLNEKELTFEEVAKKFSKLSSSAIIEFIGKTNKFIPRKARMLVLRSLLDEQVRILKFKNLNLSDETNYRLNWYRQFSETQLVNLLKQLDEDGSLQQYFKEDIWLMFLHVANDLGISDAEIEKLFISIDSARISNREEFDVFNENIGALFYDAPGELDGIPVEVFRNALVNSSTLVELRQIAAIHNINVPRRIKKEELVEIIFKALMEQGKLDDNLKQSLPEKSVIQLQRFAKDNDIKASVELKKEEIIDYILNNLNFDQEKTLLVIDYNQDYPRRFNTVISDNFEFMSAPKVEEVKVAEPIQPVIQTTVVQGLDVDAVVEIVNNLITERLAGIKLTKDNIDMTGFEEQNVKNESSENLIENVAEIIDKLITERLAGIKLTKDNIDMTSFEEQNAKNELSENSAEDVSEIIDKLITEKLAGIKLTKDNIDITVFEENNLKNESSVNLVDDVILEEKIINTINNILSEKLPEHEILESQKANENNLDYVKESELEEKVSVVVSNIIGGKNFAQVDSDLDELHMQVVNGFDPVYAEELKPLSEIKRAIVSEQKSEVKKIVFPEPKPIIVPDSEDYDEEEPEVFAEDAEENIEEYNEEEPETIKEEIKVRTNENSNLDGDYKVEILGKIIDQKLAAFEKKMMRKVISEQAIKNYTYGLQQNIYDSIEQILNISIKERAITYDEQLLPPSEPEKEELHEDFDENTVKNDVLYWLDDVFGGPKTIKREDLTKILKIANQSLYGSSLAPLIQTKLNRVVTEVLYSYFDPIVETEIVTQPLETIDPYTIEGTMLNFDKEFLREKIHLHNNKVRNGQKREALITDLLLTELNAGEVVTFEEKIAEKIQTPAQAAQENSEIDRFDNSNRMVNRSLGLAKNDEKTELELEEERARRRKNKFRPIKFIIKLIFWLFILTGIVVFTILAIPQLYDAIKEIEALKQVVEILDKIDEAIRGLFGK